MKRQKEVTMNQSRWEVKGSVLLLEVVAAAYKRHFTRETRSHKDSKIQDFQPDLLSVYPRIKNRQRTIYMQGYLAPC